MNTVQRIAKCLGFLYVRHIAYYLGAERYDLKSYLLFLPSLEYLGLSVSTVRKAG